MTLPVYKNGEPIYTVIYRDTEARTQLQKWITTSRSIQARVDDNKMYIFDHNTLSLFVVTWQKNWDNILIWDLYLKRHITF
jgi:hypothetical protein